MGVGPLADKVGSLFKVREEENAIYRKGINDSLEFTLKHFPFSRERNENVLTDMRDARLRTEERMCPSSRQT